MSSSTIRAIVFDFDGTLVDTESCEYEVFCKIYEEHGHVLELEKWAVCVGTIGGPFNPYDDLQELTGKVLDRNALRERFKVLHEESLREVKLRLGVLGLLDEAKQLGLRIGLASSSDRKWIDRHLREQGIADYFEAIYTRDDVELVKPDPTLYRLAVEALGVQPFEAVAVEDSLNGLKAAKAAGMKAIAVPNPITSHMDLSQADIQITGYENLTLAGLLERL
ncbi:HAD family phosphatase [Paenibacillus sp. CF384]|uniref:HAD family hydrolase n=1 Tax=Paenibacillus sp. CF384 TaxID=1884382 RepID=UPI00089CA77A|nr:HAD-IA family hydrolase [Paenibacillus sp. CF384]SDW65216.1 putative hydrolase of the HAD superfamily [Paenibacillus sp. CF384]